MLTNIRRDKRFEALLMQIVSYDIGVRFTLRNETISELATYGVISKGTDGMCEILNPIYHYCIMQTFKPLVNGLENEYLPVDNTLGFRDYLTSSGEIDMMLLLNNFDISLYVRGSACCKCQMHRKSSLGSTCF